MSFQEKGGRRNASKARSYAPIMLTSKSIKPIEKTDFKKQLTQQQMQLEKIMFDKQQVNSYQMFNKQLQKRKRKVLISDYLLLTNKKDNFNDMFRFQQMQKNKQEKYNIKLGISTSIVKMQFCSADKTVRKNNSRYYQFKTKGKLKQDTDILQKGQNLTFSNMYCTNAKTFDQLERFGKINKNYDIASNAFKQKVYQRKLAKINKLKCQQQWNRYLNNYYLKIKQVNPIAKMNSTMRQSSQLKDSDCQYVNLQQISDINIQGIMPNQSIMARQKQIRISKLQMQTQNSYYQNIQSDVLAKKAIVSKKDFFVFGMSDIQAKNQNINKLKFETYKDFIWKINFSNALYIKLQQQISSPYKFYVGKGNNSQLIKGIMKRRFWWQIVQKLSDQPNFVWTQLKVGEFHNIQKAGAYKSPQFMIQRKQKIQKTIQQLDNDTIQTILLNKKILIGKDSELWEHNYRINKCHQDKLSQKMYQKRLKTLIKIKKVTYIQKSQSLKVHNHFECNYFLGNKKALFYSLKKYYTLQKQNPFQFIPLTFHITDGINDPQFSLFLTQFQNLAQQRLTNKELKNIWIMKPGQNSNRGRGITVCATLDQIKIRLRNKQKSSDGSNRTYILQRYIEKPLLYFKRKFDIRHYMLMTCVNNQMKGYWYSQGYIRTTSSEYNIKNCKDLYTHLTNDAIQKNSSDYGKYQKGNKLSYQDFQKYLTKHVSKSSDFFGKILPTMKKLAKDSISSTYSFIQPNRKQHNFQLFGLDFMIDEEMRIYLIQVNTNPCLQISCPLLGKIITPLIQNVFKICIDPIFPPMYEFPNNRKFQLGQNSFSDNKFQLFFDQNIDGTRLKQLYQNQNGIDSKMGVVEQENQLYQDQGQWKEQQNI